MQLTATVVSSDTINGLRKASTIIPTPVITIHTVNPSQGKLPEVPNNVSSRASNSYGTNGNPALFSS